MLGHGLTLWNFLEFFEHPVYVKTCSEVRETFVTGQVKGYLTKNYVAMEMVQISDRVLQRNDAKTFRYVVEFFGIFRTPGIYRNFD